MFMTNTIFLKWGILNVPFCSIFQIVPFHFYLVITMTLVVPCLDNIFMVLLISELAKIGATKPIFLDSGSLGVEGEARACMCGHGLLSLYSSYAKFKEKTLFSLSLTAICAELCWQTT